MTNRSRRRAAIVTILCAVSSYSSAIHSAPVFYLSTQSTGATPGLLDLTGLNQVAPNSTGTIYIWASSDIRLSGVSLDLVETGGAIKFTGFEVANPAGPPPRWDFLDGPPVVTNSAMTHIGGGAIPGVTGDGIGQGSLQVANLLFASVNYMALASGTSQLSLRVGNNGIANWEGEWPQVCFGSTGCVVPHQGDDFGEGSIAGTITVAGDPPPLPPVVVDLNLGDRVPGSIIDHTFATSVGAAPIAWGNLVASGPGALANAPSLTPAGGFSWNSTGSPFGQYNFDVTATNAGGSDVGRLSLNLVSPAPVIVDESVPVFPGELFTYTFRARDPDTPAANLTWSDFTFEGTGVAIQPTFDSLTQLFSWNTAGTPDGVFTARVKITDSQGLSDTGMLRIVLDDFLIPEPATLTLFGTAMIGAIGLIRRRGSTTTKFS